MATEYGARLRAARKHAGLTQVQAQKATGIPQSTISTAEREGHGSADTPVYAKAYGVDAHWLATGEGQMAPQSKFLPGMGIENLEFSQPEDVVGAPKQATVSETISSLGEFLSTATEQTRAAVADLLSRYAQDPSGGKAIAQAIVLLINADRENKKDHDPSARQ